MAGWAVVPPSSVETAKCVQSAVLLGRFVSLSCRSLCGKMEWMGRRNYHRYNIVAIHTYILELEYGWLVGWREMFGSNTLEHVRVNF